MIAKESGTSDLAAGLVPACRSRVIAALWPDDLPGLMRIWAVLDGARDPRIAPLARCSYRDKALLLGDALSPLLQEVSPTLVQVEDKDTVTWRLLEQGWGKSWGIFLRSEARLGDLKRHLRGLLRVRDEQGRRFLFRYYDPRVLRIYLPTCTAEELASFFGPVREVLMEDETPGALLRFVFLKREGRLEVTRLTVG